MKTDRRDLGDRVDAVRERVREDRRLAREGVRSRKPALLGLARRFAAVMNVATVRVRIERGALSWFGFSGKRPGATGWTPGRYRGSYQLLRGGALVSAGEAAVDVR